MLQNRTQTFLTNRKLNQTLKETGSKFGIFGVMVRPKGLKFGFRVRFSFWEVQCSHSVRSKLCLLQTLMYVLNSPASYMLYKAVSSLTFRAHFLKRRKLKAWMTIEVSTLEFTQQVLILLTKSLRHTRPFSRVFSIHFVGQLENNN